MYIFVHLFTIFETCLPNSIRHFRQIESRVWLSHWPNCIPKLYRCIDLLETRICLHHRNNVSIFESQRIFLHLKYCFDRSQWLPIWKFHSKSTVTVILYSWLEKNGAKMLSTPLRTLNTHVDVQIVLDFIQKLIGLENRNTFAGNFEVHRTYSAFQLDIVVGR